MYIVFQLGKLVELCLLSHRTPCKCHVVVIHQDLVKAVGSSFGVSAMSVRQRGKCDGPLVLKQKTEMLIEEDA